MKKKTKQNATKKQNQITMKINEEEEEDWYKNRRPNEETQQQTSSRPKNFGDFGSDATYEIRLQKSRKG